MGRQARSATERTAANPALEFLERFVCLVLSIRAVSSGALGERRSAA